MSLCGCCSEIHYMLVDLLNAIGETTLPTFRNQPIAEMFICVGFVTHDYKRLTLQNDFGARYWQHSTKVHNGARNHMWLEFPKPGADPSDQTQRVMLDLTAPQFDILMPRGIVAIIEGGDSRYTKCYELTAAYAPVHFLNWTCNRNNTEFDAQHIVDTITRFQQQFGIPRQPSSLPNAHAILVKILRGIGVVGPGALMSEAQHCEDVKKLERACGVTLNELKSMDDVAAMRMRSTLGHGPTAERGGRPPQ
mmetsp:Transcript_12722/g.33761  ORF Transcript_12722/g.33761 Transcript_12722/m.33761 type:complete len:250 (+) Transcript_12722:3-752(+)